jgi:cholesterol transport system auxiliary component
MNTRRRLLHVLPAATGAAALSGCTSWTLNDAPRFEFFVIEDRHAPPATVGTAARPPRIDRTLLLTTGDSQALYESDRIVFTPDGVSRSYYQYANWSERPGRRILSLAETRLAGGGGFRSVARTTGAVRGDLILTLRLDELAHHVAAPPGELRLALNAELVDWRSRILLARRRFVQSVPVTSFGAPGAARAANVAVTAVLDALGEWVEASAAPTAAAGRG